MKTFLPYYGIHEHFVPIRMKLPNICTSMCRIPEVPDHDYVCCKLIALPRDDHPPQLATMTSLGYVSERAALEGTVTDQRSRRLRLHE